MGPLTEKYCLKAAKEMAATGYKRVKLKDEYVYYKPSKPTVQYTLDELWNRLGRNEQKKLMEYAWAAYSVMTVYGMRQIVQECL